MAKGSSWQKQKLAKHRANQQRGSHGGFARFSPASVETRDAFGHYYSGDNNIRPILNDDGKRIGTQTFWPANQCTTYHQLARQGEWKVHIDATENGGVERRDGGSRRDADKRAASVDVGDAKVRRVATHKVTTREHLRDSLGTGSLLATAMGATKRNATWTLYNKDGTRKA